MDDKAFQWLREGVELVSVLFAIWWHSSATKRRQEEMHKKNNERLAVIEERVSLIYTWMKSVVFGIRKSQ
jgi:hypothetical protein